MKTTARLLLFVFIAFLITPTIVSIIEKTTDISVFYSLSEEEKEIKEIKEIKAIFNFEVFDAPVYLSKLNSGLIHSENLSKHDKIPSKIFIPPPEQV